MRNGILGFLLATVIGAVIFSLDKLPVSTSHAAVDFPSEAALQKGLFDASGKQPEDNIGDIVGHYEVRNNEYILYYVDPAYSTGLATARIVRLNTGVWLIHTDFRTGPYFIREPQ